MFVVLQTFLYFICHQKYVQRGDRNIGADKCVTHSLFRNLLSSELILPLDWWRLPQYLKWEQTSLTAEKFPFIEWKRRTSTEWEAGNSANCENRNFVIMEL